MEPVSLILQALVTGAAKAASDAAPDVYKALKELIKRKFAGEPKAEMVLEEHEKDPKTYEAPLTKKLVETGADKDEEIIKKALEVLKAADPQGAVAGVYNVTVGGNVYGVAGENIGTVNQTFNQ